jgi:hypothetical protein
MHPQKNATGGLFPALSGFVFFAFIPLLPFKEGLGVVAFDFHQS